MLTLVQQLVGVHSPVVAANLWRGGDVLLAVAPDNGMAAWQKVSFLMGMLILIYTVVKMGVRRRMVLANHANRGSRGDSSPGADHSPGRSGLSGWFGLGSLRGGSPAITPVGGERHRTLTPRRELESLVVNLRETGREIEARLDTKIRFAQRLLQEAEETLTQLELARARTEAVARSEGASRRIGNESPKNRFRPRHSLVEFSLNSPHPCRENRPEIRFLAARRNVKTLSIVFLRNTSMR